MTKIEVVVEETQCETTKFKDVVRVYVCDFFLLLIYKSRYELNTFFSVLLFQNIALQSLLALTNGGFFKF